MSLPPAYRAMAGVVRLLGNRVPGPETALTTPLEERRASKPGKVFLRKPPAGVTIDHRTVDGVPVRTYRTASSSGRTLVYIHGGGFMVGGFDSCDHICRDLAHHTGDFVVSVDYRLAPEDPFPAGLDDCDTVLQWVLSNTDASHVSVGGDSAGGNLTAALALRHPGAFSRQVLIYPMLDLTCSRDSWVTETLLPPTREQAYELIGHYASYRKDPLVSPLFATSLAGQPPALVITAQHDTLRDDGRDYAELLRAAGVATRYSEYARMPHAFLSLPRLAGLAYDQCIGEIAGFLRGIA